LIWQVMFGAIMVRRAQLNNKFGGTEDRMAFPRGRTICAEDRTYEWVVRQRGNTLRLVVQDADARGQLLVAYAEEFCLCERGDMKGDFYYRPGIGPQAVRQRVAEALAAGWQPARKGLPPFRLSAEVAGLQEFSDPSGLGHVTRDHVEDLWTVGRVLRQDPAWRDRLWEERGRRHPVPPEYLRAIDPELADRIQARGGAEAYLRHWDPSDGWGQPYYLAIASRPDGLVLVLLDLPGQGVGS
jgi:hypothetical protein